MTKPHKVFQAQIGFYDTIVAAPSRPAALRAWGTHQDLFACGAARVTSDEEAIAAAVEHPEQPLRRAVGSQDAFSLEPTSLPNIPDGPRKKSPPNTTLVPPPRPVADRTALNAAETELRKIDELRIQEEADFQKEAEALAARRRSARTSYTKTRGQANDLVTAARANYKKAGRIA